MTMLRHETRQPATMEPRGDAGRELRHVLVGKTAAALGLLLATFLAGSAVASAAEVTTEKTDRGVVVKVDGKLFTEYLIRSGAKPILWPVIGPTGAKGSADSDIQLATDSDLNMAAAASSEEESGGSQFEDLDLTLDFGQAANFSTAFRAWPPSAQACLLRGLTAKNGER